MSETGRIAGVELGGTKAIALLWQDGTALDELRVPTRDPDATFADLLPRLQRWWDDRPFDALGIASFGPVTLDQDAEDHGYIRTTPKPGWTRTAVLPRLRPHFACPIAIETDVNAAALAEYRWGRGQGADSLVYLTIGTGVGGGVLIGGQPVHGRLHPELGHLLLRRAPGDTFAGNCPFHRDCVEGLLSGPALHARFGVDAATVPASDARWDVVAHDLAQFLAVLIHSLSPNKILIGGGVGMGAPWLIERAPALVLGLLGGYYPEVDVGALAQMIRPPQLGDPAGPMGAIAVGLLASGLDASADIAPEMPAVW
jgi:fructokinase